jgi:hypothetical protein
MIIVDPMTDQIVVFVSFWMVIVSILETKFSTFCQHSWRSCIKCPCNVIELRPGMFEQDISHFIWSGLVSSTRSKKSCNNHAVTRSKQFENLLVGLWIQLFIALRTKLE